MTKRAFTVSEIILSVMYTFFIESQ